MSKENRKFAVPYSGIEPEKYIERLKDYEKNIDQVFLGIPTIINNHENILNSSDSISEILNNEYNCYKFLSLTIDSPYKRMITLNNPFYNISKEDYLLFVNKDLRKLVEVFNISGVIVADFEMALAIKEFFPDLEIETSCNSFQWNTSMMRRWRDELGVKIFNAPREILRYPSDLKHMKEEGFDLKCLVNEGCVCGCPCLLNHCVNVGRKNFGNLIYCDEVAKLRDFMKCDWILPRHLKLFDEYVSVYKIAGRSSKCLENLFYMIDSYINERDDVDVLGITVSRFVKRFDDLGEIYLPTKMVSDKILDCECRDCDDCKICENTIKKIIKIAYDSNKLKSGISLEEALDKV